MSQIKHDRQAGFTVLELTLAMAFLSFILVFVVTVLLQLLQLYDKGLTLKDVNQAGRSITADIKQTVKSANSTKIDLSYNTGGTDRNRLCFGTISYVWNEQGGTANRFTTTLNGSNVVSFARVYDPGAQMCQSSLPNVPRASSSELISPQLRVQYFDVTTVATNRKIYDVRYVLSTSDQSLLLSPTAQGLSDPTAWRCSELVSLIDRQYCGVSVFKTSVFVTGQ